MTIDHLLFDTTDFETMEDTHSAGAYVRSGRSGALITHHSPVEAGTVTFDFVDGDVTVGTDSIAETSHGMLTGDVVQLTTTGTLPTGLSTATDYYVIRVDADNFKLAASAKDAEENNPVDITAAAGGGTHTVTEQDTDRRALDTWIMNPSIEVTATDLDIRDLTAASDSVESWTHDGTGTAITSTVNGPDTGLDVNIINASDIEVIANAEKNEDDAHTSGDTGNYVLGVRMDDVDGANGALLAGIEGDYQSLFTNAKGELHTRDNDAVDLLTAIDLDTSDIHTNTDTLVAATHLEDDPHVSGDRGMAVWAVRNDAGTPLAADQDYIPFTTDSSGNLWVNVANEIDIEDAALANTAIANNVNTLAVADTAEDVVASPLANRKYLWIYNNDNRKLYVGASGVSSADGFPLSPGAYLELRAGASIDIEWVSAKVGHDMRHLELS